MYLLLQDAYNEQQIAGMVKKETDRARRELETRDAVIMTIILAVISVILFPLRTATKVSTGDMDGDKPIMVFMMMLNDMP